MKREGDCSSSSCVKNVTVSDALSGQIVFQRVYAWKTASAFSNLGSLIKVFYQFAREVDDGVISKIDFQAQRNTLRRKRDDVLKCKRGDTMQMVTVKTEDVIVSVFFDLDGLLQPSIRLKNCFQILLHALQLAFESNFLPALQEWRSSSSAQYAPSEIEGESSKTFPAFADFSETVDRLCDLVFSDDPVGLSESSKALTISNETIDSKARSYLQVLGLL